MDAQATVSRFLKSRRARLRPEDVGVPGYGTRRRVPGLRREELAQLAGVSVTHYTRLEQGRGTSVSTEVLDAVADALRLSTDEREYLANLVHPPKAEAPQPRPGQRPARGRLHRAPSTQSGPVRVVQPAFRQQRHAPALLPAHPQPGRRGSRGLRLVHGSGGRAPAHSAGSAADPRR